METFYLTMPHVKPIDINQKRISFKGVQRQNVSNPFNLHSFHVTICKIVFHSDVDNWLLSSMRHRTKKEGQQNKLKMSLSLNETRQIDAQYVY